MKELEKNFKEIVKNQHTLLFFMVVLGLSAIIFFVFSIVSLRPNTTLTSVSYTDIGAPVTGNNSGYLSDDWWEMLSFAILALILGVLHNFLIVKIFGKYGSVFAKFFALVSFGLVVNALLVLFRLLGEG